MSIHPAAPFPLAPLWARSDLQSLQGAVIREVWVSSDSSILSFAVDDSLNEDGRITFMVYSECCSEAWFSDIEGVHALLGEVVRNIRVRSDSSLSDYNTEDGRTRGGHKEADEVFGFTLETDKGACDFLFRNSGTGAYAAHLVPSLMGCPTGMTRIRGDWHST